MQRVGLDLGYGYVKVVNEGGQRWSFPSVVARKLTTADPNALLTRGGQLPAGISVDHLEVGIETLGPEREPKQGYWVGRLALRSPNATRPFGDNKADDVATQVLTAVACAVALRWHGQDIHVATGLPYGQFMRRELRQALARALKDRAWIVEFPRAGGIERQVTISKVTVYPQAVGALYAFLTSRHPQAQAVLQEPGPVALIDIGTKTTDFVVVDMPEMEYRADLCGTVPVGMATVYAALRAYIEQETGMVLDEAQVEQAARDGQLHTRHGTMDLREAFERECRVVAEQIRNRLELRWQQRGLYRHVLLAGGGADPLREPLKAFDRDMITIPRAQYANAEGYLAMLQLEERHAQVS